MQRRDAVVTATTAASDIPTTTAQLQQLITTASSMTAPANTTTTTTFVTTTETTPSSVLQAIDMVSKEVTGKNVSQDMDTTETETSLDTSAEVAASDLGESREAEEDEEDFESEESDHSHNVTKESRKDFSDDKPLDYTNSVAHKSPAKLQQQKQSAEELSNKNETTNDVVVVTTTAAGTSSSVDLANVKKEILTDVETEGEMQTKTYNANNNVKDDDNNTIKEQTSSVSSME